MVEHTLPMHNHGDKMFQQVYQTCKLTAEKDFIRDCDRPEMERRHRRKLQEQTQIMAMQSKISAALFLNIDGVLNIVEEPFAQLGSC